VGSVCGIVTSMDLKQTEYFNLMDNLNAFIRDARLSGDVAHRLRNYFRYRRGEVDAKEWHTMVGRVNTRAAGGVSRTHGGTHISQCGLTDTAQVARDYSSR
jgi:hypothetical protein